MPKVSNHILKQLDSEDKKYLDKIENKLMVDKKLLHNTCRLVVKKVGQKDVSDFDKLQGEQKLQACMDHLAISLVSGNIEKQEVDDILKKK